MGLPRTKGDDWLFPSIATRSEVAESSLLDVIDNVLNHGVVLHGELILGVANVDLIYAKLSVLLAAMDKLHAYEHERPNSAMSVRLYAVLRLRPRVTRVSLPPGLQGERLTHSEGRGCSVAVADVSRNRWSPPSITCWSSIV